MQIRGRVFRLSILFGILAGVVVFPASPGLAGSSHTTFSFAALPAALTLSDNSPHLGLVKAAFATQNTTATHTVLTVSTTQPTGPSTSVPFPVTVTSIVQQPVPKACAGTVSGSLVTTPVTCNLGNVNPNTTLPPLLIEFQSPAGCAMGVPPCVLTATGSVTFAEGNTNQGTDSSIVPRNIQLFSTAQKASANGDCVPLSPGSTATLGTAASSTANQAAQVTFGPADPSTDNPCTPGVVGAQNFPNAGKPANSPLVLNQIWFVNLPPLAGNGLATATLQVAHLPGGTNKNNFALMEFATDLYGTAAFDPTRFSKVQSCVGSPLQPPPGQDSCMSNVSSLPGGGLSITVILLPAAGDSSYTG